MSEACQFWISLGVDVVLAIATVGIFIAAIWGDRLRLWLFPPSLGIRFVNKTGEAAREQWSDPAGTKRTMRQSRFFHLEVYNKANRRSPVASDVMVFLTEIETIGPDGNNFQTRWQGKVPVCWRHQDVTPPTRMIGPPVDIDLCSVVEGKAFSRASRLVRHGRRSGLG